VPLVITKAGFPAALSLVVSQERVAWNHIERYQRPKNYALVYVSKVTIPDDSLKWS
jgi:hypothetical protein